MSHPNHEECKDPGFAINNLVSLDTKSQGSDSIRLSSKRKSAKGPNPAKAKGAWCFKLTQAIDVICRRTSGRIAS
jgi:hypothetical protein